MGACVTGVFVGAGVTVTGAAVGSILSQIGSHGSYKQVLKGRKEEQYKYE